MNAFVQKILKVTDFTNFLLYIYIFSKIYVYDIHTGNSTPKSMKGEKLYVSYCQTTSKTLI